MSYPYSTCKVTIVGKKGKDRVYSSYVLGELESTGKKVDGLLVGQHKSKFREYLGELRVLISIAKSIGIHHKIVFHPLLV